MEVHGYTQSGSIDATIDGVRGFVPDAMSNRDRQMLAEWEAAGNIIPPYVPPPPPSPYSPLQPYQFWTAVRATGHEADLLNWVASIENPLERASGSAMLEFSQEYRFEHPFMDAARQALGLPRAEFEALWLWAKTL